MAYNPDYDSTRTSCAGCNDDGRTPFLCQECKDYHKEG